MILGDLCTRTCRFCAVASAREGRPLREEEGREIAGAVGELKLRYVVLTSVDRDDLPLRGAEHFAACVGAIKDGKAGKAGTRVEALIPDYTESELACFTGKEPDVWAHNVETVRSLQWVRDRRSSFDKSLATLRAAKKFGASKGALTKSSLMLGLGEKKEEVLSAMDEVRGAGVDILVLGQYLRPSPRQLPVAAYIHPDDFFRYAEEARDRGFSSVVSSPLARTSYHAHSAAEGVV
jgi:lipoic acid synthetase